MGSSAHRRDPTHKPEEQASNVLLRQQSQSPFSKLVNPMFSRLNKTNSVLSSIPARCTARSNVVPKRQTDIGSKSTGLYHIPVNLHACLTFHAHIPPHIHSSTNYCDNTKLHTMSSNKIFRLSDAPRTGNESNKNVNKDVSHKP